MQNHLLPVPGFLHSVAHELIVYAQQLLHCGGKQDVYN